MVRTKVARLARNLNMRLVMVLLAVHIILIPTLFSGVLYLVKRGYKEQFINHVRSEAYLFANIASRDLSTEGLSSLIEEVSLFGKVIFAQFIDNQGTIIYTYEEMVEPSKFIEDFYFDENGDGIYFIEVPITINNLFNAYTLRLGFDETVTRNQIQIAYQRGIYLAVIYIGLTLALLALLLPKLNKMRREIIRQASILEYQSLHDKLTGLPNRALLEDRIRRALAEGTRYKHYTFALLLIDLNRFKEVNDTLGHAAGDTLLQETSTRLRNLVRTSDSVVRLGGDEFAVFLPNIDVNGASAVARKLVDNMDKPFHIEQQSLHIGASIGVAISPLHGSDVKTLMRHVDLAMYEAKRTKSGFALYDESMDKDSMQRLAMTNQLQESIKQGDFVLYYQPKVCTKTGKLSGLEALLRWKHPQRGLVLPNEFIHLAENSGLIRSLTEWVLREAVHQISEWNEKGLRTEVAVNLSPLNLQDIELTFKLRRLLSEYQVDPSQLELEITESAIFSDIDRATENLQRIHNMGIRLSIDDFGTGYSSLIHLKQLPISQIKIDRSFIRDLNVDPNSISIVNTIIELAHNLKLLVIAEGAEERSTINFLRKLGCDYVQGYVVSAPLPAVEIEYFIQNRALKRTPLPSKPVLTLVEKSKTEAQT